MMPFQGLADSLFSHQDLLFGKIAVHDHHRMAQRLTRGGSSIGKDTYLQGSERVCVWRYRRFWNDCCRSTLKEVLTKGHDHDGLRAWPRPLSKPKASPYRENGVCEDAAARAVLRCPCLRCGGGGASLLRSEGGRRHEQGLKQH